MIGLFLDTLIPLAMLAAFGTLLGGWLMLAWKMDAALERMAIRFGSVLAVFYGVWLIADGFYLGYLPLRTPGQLLVFWAGLIWIGHSALQARHPQRMLTLLPLGSVLLLLLAGIGLGHSPFITHTEVMESSRAAVHILISLAAVTFLIGSGVFSAGEVILHRQLKRRTFGRWFHNLPSLREMNVLRRSALTVGWAMVTLSVVGGLAMLWIAPDGDGTAAAHMHPMLLFWALITGVWVTDRFRWLGQQKMAAASLAISAVMVLLLAISVIGFFRGTLA